ncbi:MAG TPA: orotate phosphoribosyltransferase [Gammaproteobacteria bacterium]|nr:orotate phosphoribosyltransferase [Acidiferrobacteraceae bacterium]MDP6398976.1 orotate phosphoribosyltransferase [Arenicellales bacterium]HCX87642.1 orotate phosphoribosyltransferase [Gammaproteobacteria bacterium]MDP6550919.1 orotate phosphoribosyltransferase [Arenicellales bacterium]MDP6790705.1 orotate phosphoribosyltransferase [Arenicellales bacterium]|tara:strand:- start:27472 stop:28149 length:678 start_codon:yes stop_codon:yes gene_type:complete
MPRADEQEHAFLQFALETGVLRFGEFTLKSGRVSPYFFNAGLFNSGAALSRLAYFYATALHELEAEPFMLYGPAYKGIPLVSATAVALADHYRRDVAFAFNRKEAKDHGEGGQLVGAPLHGDVVIIDDVITAGTSIRESVDIISATGASATAVLIALDREEAVTEDGDSAVAYVAKTFGLRVHPLARFSTLLPFLSERPELANHLDALQAYQARYGRATSAIESG